MQTTGISSSYTDFSDLARLKTASIDDPQKALESVARQFEALFTQMIFKSMRSSELSSGLFDSNQTKMYQDILDKQLSTSLSSQKGLGIADMLIRQLTRSQTDSLPIASSSQSTVTSGSNIHQVQSVRKPEDHTELDVPGKFVAKLYPIAKDLESEYKIPARYMLAQSALETGWGQHIIHDNSGANSFNLFGIKADDNWHGKVVVANTTEYASGQPTTKYERFRAYDNYKDSMIDYAKLISSNLRYEAAYQQKAEPEKYFMGLQLAGYATDPSYSSKINNILNRIESRNPDMT